MRNQTRWVTQAPVRGRGRFSQMTQVGRSSTTLLIHFLPPPLLLSISLAQPAVMDKSVQRVQNKLASMLDRLELEIQSVEKRIGDKLHMLDRDEVRRQGRNTYSAAGRMALSSSLSSRRRS